MSDRRVSSTFSDWWAHRETKAAVAVLAAACVLIACGIMLGKWLSNAPVERGMEVVPEQAQNQTPTSKTPNPTKKVQDPFKKDTQPPPLVKGQTLMAKLVECDLKLAAPESMRERVEALAEMAQALQQETQLLARKAKPADLMKLAQMYKQVVHEGMVPRARDLPMEERGMLDGLARQLAKAGNDAEQMAKQVPASAPAFREIAAAARAGRQQLLGLMEGLE